MKTEARAEGQHPYKDKCPKITSAEQGKRSTLLGVGCPFSCCEAGPCRTGLFFKIHTTDTHSLVARVCGSQQLEVTWR